MMSDLRLKECFSHLGLELKKCCQATCVSESNQKHSVMSAKEKVVHLKSTFEHMHQMMWEPTELSLHQGLTDICALVESEILPESLRELICIKLNFGETRRAQQLGIHEFHDNVTPQRDD